jgi:hypothetical protein
MYFCLAIWVLLILYEFCIAFNRLYFYDAQKEVKRRQDNTVKAIELEILRLREQGSGRGSWMRLQRYHGGEGERSPGHCGGGGVASYVFFFLGTGVRLGERRRERM